MNVITDKRIGNAILRRALKQSVIEVPKGFVMEVSNFGYIEWHTEGGLSWSDLEYSPTAYTNFHNVEYKDKKYRSQYFDGCFKPYIVEMAN